MIIAFKLGFKTTSVWDWLVCLVTCSRYSHAGIVWPDGSLFSSDPHQGGVGLTKYNLSDGTWDLYTIPGDWTDGVQCWCRSKIGSKYDWIGALLCPWHVWFISSAEWFCSELVATVLNKTFATMANPPATHLPIDIDPGQLSKLIAPFATVERITISSI